MANPFTINVAPFRPLLVMILVMAACLGSGVAFAQKNSPGGGPDSVVQKLYAVHKNGNGQLFSKQSKTLIFQFFDKNLAELLWKNLTETPEDEVGNLDFDPLYNAQDIQITRLKVAKPKITGVKANVKVSFDNYGTMTHVSFPMVKTPDGWRIANVVYADGSSLVKILSAPIPKGNP